MSDLSARRPAFDRIATSAKVLILFAVGLVSAGQASSYEFRKCNFKMSVSAIGIPETEVQGARYTAWARQLYTSAAWDLANHIGQLCGSVLTDHDWEVPPESCEQNSLILHQGGLGLGVSGPATSRVKSLVKDVVCRMARRPDGGSAPTDERFVSSLTITIGPVGNSQACRRQVVDGPREISIHCRSTGQDTPNVWHHNLPEPLADSSGGTEIGNWKIAAPLIRARTLDGVYPVGRAIPMTVDVSNFSGKHHRPGSPGGVAIRVEGKFPAVPVTDLRLAAVDDLGTATLAFSVAPLAPGVHYYFACLTGLQTPTGWPMGEVCSPRTTVNAGFSSNKSATPNVSSDPQPARPIRPQVPTVGAPLPGAVVPAVPLVPTPLARQPDAVLRALQPSQPGTANCTGGRSPNAQGRCVCPAGTQWNAAAERCTAAQASPTAECTGGRSPNAQGRCVCPQGTQWNAGASRCTAPRQAGSGSGQLECRDGEVRGILCWCGIGRFPRSLGGNVYQCQ